MLKRILLAALIILALVVEGRAAAEQVINRVVAVVGDEVITAVDLDRAIRQTKAQMARLRGGRGNQELPPGQIRRLALERLIDDKLFDKEVKRLNLKVSRNEVEHYINRIKKANKLNEEEFVARLSRQGLTPEEYRENLRKDILKQKLINYEVKKQVVISDADVEEYFKKHKAEYENLDEVNVRAIFLTLEPGAGLAARNVIRQKAQNLRQQLQEGADFATLAQKHSQGPGAAQGGSLGKIKAGDLLPAMRQALAELKPGQISPVLQIPQGLVIMQLVDRSGAKSLALEEVREQIRSKLERQALEERFRQWMKELRAQTYVKVID